MTKSHDLSDEPKKGNRTYAVRRIFAIFALLKTKTMDFKQLSAERYSCREFTDQPVDDRLIEEIVRLTTLAPTAVNYQPMKLFIVKDETKRKQLCEAGNIRFAAPVYIILAEDEQAAWKRSYDGHNFADVDGGIVGGQLLLAVQELGLCTVWVGSFNAPEVKKAFAQLAGYTLTAVFPIGYASADKPSPRHAQRKSVGELSEEL
jgi:nitroreductase